MGNPKPTKSKPCKIGRKHTGALSIRLQAKKALGKLIQKKINKSKFKKWKRLVKEYWLGKLENYPGK